MLYFIFLTHSCNLACTYCGEVEHPILSLPREISYSLSQLESFLMDDPNPIIVFYGGEPLLRITTLEKIMDRLKNATFLLQTNGYYLARIPPSYLNRFQTILISIDGRKQINDLYRGKGTYNHIRRNMKIIKENDYKGDLIARMTVSSNSDIYQEVKSLLSLRNPAFNHVHWQLDVIWSDKEQWHDFNSWVQNIYNPGIAALIEEWVVQMSQSNQVLGIVPFIGIMKTLLSGISSKLRCRAGMDAFAIQTNGEIYACPVCPEFSDFKVGNLFTSRSDKIRNQLLIRSPCVECEIYAICGGRCLFANYHNFWDDDFFAICKTVKFLIDELKRVKPVIEEMIKESKLSFEMFDYPKFNNSCEIIP
ncbi:MAG: TIGR04084 family radical SAM/SPASM domain-containing protein [Candidatus Hermodarchaeota archaeon]